MSTEPTLISAGELHVWSAQLDLNEWPGAERLPGEERERAAQLLRPEAHRRRVAARWALRGVLGGYLGEDPATVELSSERYGKPRLAGAAAMLRFNVSHSRGLALIAVTCGTAVGVDVEWIDPRRDVLGLAHRALDRAEARCVAETPPKSRPAAFYAAWTRREAIAKCLGTGLWVPVPESDAVTSAFDAGPGFAAAVAVAGDEIPPLRRFAIEPDLTAAGVD